LGALVSGGTVQLLSAAVGVEVASGVTVMLAQFFEQALVIRRESGDGGDGGGAGQGAGTEASA
jgi:multicomponent Na+:H+ antiporter subunit B